MNTRFTLAAGAACLSACAAVSAPQPAALHGDWQVLRLAGAPASAQTRLSFDHEAHFSATAGCNTIFGSYRVDNNRLTLPPAASTLKACDEALMAQESRLHTVLANINGAVFHIEQNRLRILDKRARPVLEAQRLNGDTP